MLKKNAPKRLWGHGLVHEAESLSRVSRGRDGGTGHEEAAGGQMAGTLEWLDFKFCGLVWWFGTGSGTKLDMTDDAQRLVHWLGVLHRVGSNMMCCWLLTESRKVTARGSPHLSGVCDLGGLLRLFQCNVAACTIPLRGPRESGRSGSER